ncbi:nucleoside triphosphate pyrophosphatase [Mycobacterium sp. NPDC006124]|uniref:Maf family protein n=1 Tax=Mycobacterium sp. NPDC006124 TaxID=3156729 RepID=UPI0033B7F187
MTRVVLASASPGRRRILRGAGIDPVVLVSGVDEDALTATLPTDAGPDVVTTALATAKAEAVARTLDTAVGADCVVIGCDSMLFRDGRLWGKPATEADAIRGWQAMAGRSSDLITGHCVLRVLANRIERRAAAHAVTTVRFGRPSAAELAAYAGTGEPVQVAGGFTLDGLGGWFVDGVDGDPSAVIGLGLPLTRSLLERVGVSVTQLWLANPVTD